MTKGRLLAIAAAAVVAASSVALVALTRDDPRAPDEASARARRPRGPQDSAALARVATLTEPTQLLALYNEWAGRDDKLGARERILDALLAGADARALKQALQAIALDPTPIDDDPMVEYAVDHLLPLWALPGLYPYGRDLLLVQAGDKTRIVLAESLAQYTTTLKHDPEGQRRAWMSSDLVDVYYQSGAEARVRLVRAARRVGGDDLAKVLEGKGAADVAVVQQRVRDTDTALGDLRARQSDPALGEVKDEVRQLLTVDPKQVRDQQLSPR